MRGKHTVLRRLPCVCRRLSRSDRALGYTANSIHFIRVKLPDAVEVKTGSIILHLVIHRDLEGISPISLNSRTRNLSIDRLHHPRHAIRTQCNVLDVEGVGADDAGVGVVIIIISLKIVGAPVGAGCGGVAGADVAWVLSARARVMVLSVEFGKGKRLTFGKESV